MRLRALGLALALACAAWPAFAAPDDGVRLAPATPGAVRFTVTVPPARLSPVTADGSAQALSIAGYGTGSPDATPTALPGRLLLVAVPPLGDVRLTAAASEASVRADQSAVANLQAAQKAEQANVENARVQLSYTTIRAPITGKTGNLVVIKCEEGLGAGIVLEGRLVHGDQFGAGEIGHLVFGDGGEQHQLVRTIRDAFQNQHACHLRHSFYNQNAGHHGKIRKMSYKKRLIYRDILDADDALLFQLDDRVHEQHRITMGKNLADRLYVKDGHAKWLL